MFDTNKKLKKKIEHLEKMVDCHQKHIYELTEDLEFIKKALGYEGSVPLKNDWFYIDLRRLTKWEALLGFLNIEWNIKEKKAGWKAVSKKKKK